MPRPLAGLVLVVVGGALAATVTLLEPSASDLLNGSDPARTEVSLPAAAPSPPANRSADRRPGPADCGDHLQDLPRPIQRASLFTGTIEWRDGRLCALRTLRDSPTRWCDPPLLACAVP